MNDIRSRFILFTRHLCLVIISLLAVDSLSAAGISIDAGLTPAKGRWIARTQFRQMYSENATGTMEMNMQMFPFVVAHGLRSDLTLMARQGYMRRKMTMMDNSSTKSGLGDLLVLAKYRLLRKNTPSYTLGIAPTLGLEFPTGEIGFGSNSWDLHAGCFLSARKGRWGIDLNLKYVWNSMGRFNDDHVDHGDELVIETALDHRFGFGQNAEFSLAPVLELSYTDISDGKIDLSDSPDPNGIVTSDPGESVLWLSPGLIFTRSSLIIEGLVRIPVSQEATGMQTVHKTGFLFGIRLMN